MRAMTPTRSQSRRLPLFLAVFLLLAAASAVAQTTVPQVLPVTGTLVGADGKPLTGDTAVTFAIYDEPEGGAPLFVEVQTVTLDDRGRFTAWVGTQGSGLPLDMFQTGLARWMGVQPAGYPEQPRVRFLAVPYALKAADAETLGGLPASAYLLNPQTASVGAGGAARRTAGDQTGATTAAKSTADRDGGVAVAGDAVTNDDVIVVGSLCVGVDCVNGESFSFDTIRLKENNTRITFMDTSTTAGYANRDWRLRANSSDNGGLNAFFIDDLGTSYTTGDETVSSTPFTIEAGASTNAFYIDSSSRVGFRTASPVLDLHVTTSNTPGMRLEQTNAGGFTAQTWDIAGNEANFFIRDVTTGSKLPFRIRPGAPTSSIDITASGNVGIGKASATSKLDVDGNVASSGAFLLGNGAYGLRHSGGIVMFDGGSDYPDGYRLATGGQPSGAVEILDNGNVGIGIVAPVQPLHVFGNIRTDATFLFGSGYGMRATGGVVRFDGGTNYPEGYSFATSGLPSGAVTITAAGLMGLNVLAPSHPLQHASGAHLTAGGVWTNASSRALKDRIAPLTAEAAQAALAGLQPVTYVYKADPGDPQVGFIAEDVPQLVATNDRTSLAPMDIVGVLTKVAQAQGQRLAAQEAELADLKVRLAELERLLLSRQR